MTKLILTSNQCPGDMIMLTAAVRDLHAAHPGKYLTDVRTPHPDIWRHNPHITPIPDGEGRVIEMHYPLINQSNQGSHHFIHGFRMYLEQQLGIVIPQGAMRGDLHLSKTECAAYPEISGHWIIASGGKKDFTAKWWDPQRWQEVVDYWRAKGIQFIQVGDKNDVHPALEGVKDLRGKTTLRELIHLIYHSAGVLCPVTSLMHISAAMPMANGAIRPCIVVAGGREPVQWEAYPGHTFLDTIGQLPCCASGGCWKSRVWPGLGGEHDNSLCERPVLIREGVHIPACLDRITSKQVIDAMRAYMLPAPPVVVHPPPEPKPCVGCGNKQAAPVIVDTDPKSWGPHKWREFHGRTVSVDAIRDLDPSAEERWLAEFIESLPCPECRIHFMRTVIHNPPRFQSMDAYREWGIDVHNVVNAKLGKPVLTHAEAEAAIERNRNRRHAEIAERGSVCLRCEYFSPATADKKPTCLRDGETNLRGENGKMFVGTCDKWPGYVEPTVEESLTVAPTILKGGAEMRRRAAEKEKAEREKDVPATSFGNKVGVVIGTYGAVPYIHLQLESLFRFHPGTPVLVVDDCSPQRDELWNLCAKYGAEFQCRDKRLGHVAGDMDVFLRGIEWAKSAGVELLVKLSRRFIPREPWIHELHELHELHKAPTYSARCERWGFGFRSECVAMCVADWQSATGPIIAAIPTAKRTYVLAEGVIHDSAGIAWRARNGNVPALHNGIGYVPWPMMGTSRTAKSSRYLWHETYTPEEYRQFGKALGIDVEMKSEKRGTLVRRNGALGDVLCITPILAELRKRHTDGPLDVATASPQALEGNEDVTATFPPHHGDEGYERVIDLNNAYEQLPTLHIVEAYARRAGTPLSDRQVKFGTRREWHPSDSVYLHCAKSWTSRTIPRETWDAVSEALKRDGFKVYALGTGSDYAPPSATDLRGKLTLPQIKERIDTCAGFIGSDSGLLHLAGATDAPIVGIYTCASHETRKPIRAVDRFVAVFPALDCYGCLATFPAPVNDLPECRRGDMACVREIKPEAIIEAFRLLQ